MPVCPAPDALPLNSVTFVRMNVRTLIVAHPDKIYRVCILAPDMPARSWMKSYDSKLTMVAELRSMELMTAREASEALESDFETRDATFVVHARTAPHVLNAAGFEEKKPTFVN
jgi:hypothetical protein